MDAFELTLNGSVERVTGVPPTVTLLEYLRHTGRVGTKEGCAEGDCGACTVAVVGENADGESVLSGGGFLHRPSRRLCRARGGDG